MMMIAHRTQMIMIVIMMMIAYIQCIYNAVLFCDGPMDGLTRRFFFEKDA